MQQNLVDIIKEMIFTILSPYGIIVLILIIIVFGYLLYSSYEGNNKHLALVRYVLIRIVFVLILGYIGVLILLLFFAKNFP